MKTYTYQNSMKKFAVIAFVCVMAVVSFTSVFAQAPGMNNQQGMQMPPMGGMQQGPQPGQGMNGQNGQQGPQMPPMGGMQQGPQQGAQPGQDMNNRNNDNFGQMPPMGGPNDNTGNLQNSIDNVSDSATQTALQALLDAYQSIMEQEKTADEDEKEELRESAHEALEVLLTAMNDAGIETQPQMPFSHDDRMPFNGNGQMGPGNNFDINGQMIPGQGPNGNAPMGQPGSQNLQELIDNVEDSTTKSALQTLLDAFETAMEAERNADEDDIESLRTAAHEAMDALMTAMKEAGIEPQQPQQPSFNGDNMQQPGQNGPMMPGK